MPALLLSFVCVFVFCSFFFFFFRKYLLSFIVYILELRVCKYLFSPNYVLLVVYFVTCSPELMSAGQTLLALMAWTNPQSPHGVTVN